MRRIGLALAGSGLLAALLVPALFPDASAAYPHDAFAAADPSGAGAGGEVVTLLDVADTDPSTNESPVGAGTGTTDLRGLAMQPGTGILFGAEIGGLGTVDRITGAFTAIGGGFGSGAGPLGTVTFSNVQGIAFDPSSGRLFAVHEKSGNDVLFEVDPATGERVGLAFGGDDYLEIVPSQTTFDRTLDIAVDPAGGGAYAVVWDGGSVYQLAALDLATGAATTLGQDLVAAAPRGLSFDATGQAWVVGSPGAGGVVAAVDKATGSLGALVSIDDSGSYQALAFITDNSSPTFDQDQGDRTDAEGTVVSLDNPVTDPEGDTLTWSATGLPAGLSIDPATGSISGTVDFTAAAASPYSTEIRVEDPWGGFDLDSFTWTITDVTVPAAPVFDQDLGDRSDAEGDTVSISASATDPNGDAITYTATGLPSGLSIDPGTGVISGTVAAGAAAGSPYAVEVTATDPGGLFATDTFSWTVTDNQAPVVVNPGDQSGDENQSVTFAVAGSDPDGDGLAWSATGLPDGLAIDPGTGVISGTLSYDSAGVHAVTVRATDPGLLFDEVGFTWTVADVNRGPVVVDPGPQTVTEGDAVSLSMSASDPEGNGFTWSATGLPAGLSIDPVSGLISGTVDFGAAAASPYTSTITATDDGSPPASGAALVDWTVVDVNEAPVVTNPGDQASAEADPVTLPITGSDPDGNTITWSATGLPPGLSIAPGSGTISGIVGYSAASGSPYAVVVTATDDGTPVLSADVAFSWTITDVNRAPVVTDPGDQAATEADVISLLVEGSDPDGDVLTWSAGGLPPGLDIDPASGEIYGTLTYSSAGTFPVVVRATDDGAGSLFTEVAFTWSVANTNRPPVAVDPGAQADPEGAVVDLPLSASDPDGDDLTWSASGLPDGLSIDPATGTIGGTIGYDAAAGSPFTVTARATDVAVPALFDEVTFAWTVTDVNRAPTVTSPGDQSNAEGDSVGVPVAGADPDGDAVYWSATGLPPGLGIDTETGALIGSIAYSAAESSPFLVTVRATDPSGLFGEASFTWSVSDTATVVDITKVSDVVGRAQPGDTIVYTVVVTNPEATPATGVAVGDPVPSGTSYVPGSAAYSMVDAARDSFESGGYGGDDGTIPWAGPWVEMDGAGSDATKDGVVGSPLCSGGSCLFVNPDFASGIEGVERPVDLSGRASATLTYLATRSPGGGSVGVRVKGNGRPWTTLATYTLTVGDPAPVPASFDISAFAGADTMIRVEGLVAGSGRLYVDDVAVVTGILTAAAGPPPGMVSGLTLAPGESVTVTYSVAVSDPPPGSGTIINTATVVSSEEPGGVSDAVSDQVNRYPVFLQDLGDRADPEGTAVSVTASATDPDGDTRSWSATGLPAGISINPSTGLISGTIGYDASSGSPYSVLVTVEDVDGLQDLDTFTWSVSNTNRPPVVVDPGSQSDAEGDVISLAISGSDPDADTVTWSASGLPPGLAIDPSSGVISGSPSYDASTASPYAVTVRATDDGAPVLFAEAVFIWDVADTNRPPVVVDPGPQSTREGDMVELTVTASDPDGDGLTWSAAGLPDGLSIDPATGEIFGDVTFTASGGSPYTVTVTATDDGVPAEAGSAVFDWTITDANRAPSIVDPGAQASGPGESVSMPMSATDPDGDAFTWSASGLPTGLSIDPASGVISGTVAAPATTVFIVEVSATDDGVPAATGLVDFRWVISDELVITKVSDGGGSAAMGQTLTYTITVADPGPSAHTGVGITDALPAGTTWLSTQVAHPIDGSAGTVGDGWETQDYAGSTGTIPWSGPWVETNDDGSPSGGKIHLHRHDNLWLLELEQGEKWITRTADLSGYSSAELSYRFRRHSLKDSGDTIVVEVSPDGSAWTEIARHTGPGDDEWQVKAPIDISEFLSATTSIRFRSLATHNDGELRVDWVEITATERVTTTGPGGAPPNLASGITLLPGESMTAEVVVRVDDPLDRSITSIDNTAAVTSDQQIVDALDSTSDAVNHGPLFDQDRGDRTDAESTAISLSNPATDPNGDLLTWSATGLPDGLSIDPSTGLVSGTITFDAAAGSPFSVILRVEDPSGVFDQDTFTWTVADTNRAPSVVDPGDQTGTEGTAVSLTMSASDPDLDTLTWTAFNLPPGLMIGSSTGVISGTPTYDAAGTYAVVVRVTDDRVPFLSDEVAFAWEVADTNRAPIVAGPGNQSDAEGDLIDVSIAGSDPDGDTLTWSATGLPGGLAIDPATGSISGTIPYDASPSSPFAVTVRVVDDGTPQLSKTVAFTWVVADTNRPPLLVSPGDRANGESDVVSLSVPASDADLDALTWSAAGLPPDLAIDPATGLIEGTVSFDAAAGSPYAVTVTVTDDRAPTLTDEISFSWLVANTNRAPVVTPMADRVSDEGDHVTVAAAGTDPDADAITWSATGLPTGLTIDPASGIISGDIAFTAADSSPFTVMITATDDGTPSLWTTVAFGWTVDDVNRMPVLANLADRTSPEGKTVAMTIGASDPDGDTLTWSASGLPDGLDIDPATGSIGGTITYSAAAASPYDVTVTVTDDRTPNLSDQAAFTWVVVNTNRAPIVTDPGAQSAGEGATVSLAITGSDPDGDGLAWSASGLPPGLSIDPASGVVSGTAGVPGAFSVIVTATDDGDPALSASVGISWTIIAAEPLAPVLEPLPDRSDLVGASVTIHPIAVSPDGETLEWSASGLPPGMAIDPATGEVSGTLTEAGVYEVGVTATDGRGLAATAGFVWTVGEGLPEDEPPRAEDDGFTVVETDLQDGVMRLSVLDNDIDPEGTDLRITWLGEVPVGEASIVGGSAILYRPPANWLGTTGFSYVVADAAGNTDTATVTVTITPDFERRAAATALIWKPTEESRATSVIGTYRAPEAQLVFGSIIQSLHVLRMPLALLGGAVIWSLLLGGAFNLTLLLRGGLPFLSRRARMHLAVVMARHGQKIPAHIEPGEGEVIHRFVATAKGIAGTGRVRAVDDVEWAEVETPGGRGWVEAIHLTEHVDGDTFEQDPVPVRMLEEFVNRLRAGGDVGPLVSRYGLWVSHHDDPVHYLPAEIEGLTTSSGERLWKGRNPAFPDVRGTFADVVAAGIIRAWDHPGRLIEVDKASVPSTIIPIEYTNLHALSIGARLTGRDRLDQEAWLAHFSYEGNTPYLIALTREG